MSAAVDPAERVSVRTPRTSVGDAFGLAATWALVTALVRRDLALHYRHTRLGFLWGVLPPLLAVGLLDLFLGRVVGAAPAAGSSSYAVFLYASLLPWQFLAHAASAGAGSVVGNAWVVSQLRFPRLALPLSHVLSGALDFALGSVVLLAWTLVASPAPGMHLLLWPVAVLAMLLLGFALGIFLAAAAARLRDVLPATPYAMQALLVASPVLYTLAAAERHVPRPVLLANPFTGVLETFRSAWLGVPFDGEALLSTVVVSLLLLVLGLRLFRRTEDRFADLA